MIVCAAKARRADKITGRGTPLLKMAGTLVLQGRQSALSPLRGCANIPDLAGVAPLPMVLAPRWGCSCGLYKLIKFIYL